MAEYLDYHGLGTFKGELDNIFATKVDKVTGKGLSTNDYTDNDKALVQSAVQDVSDKLDVSLKGAANGLAELDSNGKVPTLQLPGFVDDVLEYDSLSNFPATGETGKIYVAKDTNKTYRWSGTTYVEIGSSLALGETSSTAYRGDRGKTAYDHASAKGSAFSSGLYKITTNAEGHVTAATAVQKSDITGLGIPGSHQDISGKADKVSSATNGNFAALDANGNLTDSGHKHSDYLTSHQNISGKADKVSSATNGNFAALDANGNLTDSGHKHSDYLTEHQDISGKLDSSLKGAANGLAELDSTGKVPSSQLPGFVDDVLEYASASLFPATGETGKIYVARDTNLTYRWSGTAYVEISPSLALGETSSTAYRGDRGKTAYDHATESGRLTTAKTSGLYKISTTGEGHIGSATLVVKSDITALGIPGQDTTYDVMTGATPATDGVAGLVPAPLIADRNKFLRGDGTWTEVASPDVSNKADKVVNAVNNGFAGLDSNGNLTNSCLSVVNGKVCITYKKEVSA